MDDLEGDEYTNTNKGGERHTGAAATPTNRSELDRPSLEANDPRKKQGFDRFDRSVGRLTGAE